MVIYCRRGKLLVYYDPAAKAEAIAQARAALPAGEVHYHTHYEEHRHQHQHADQHVHVHGQERPAAEPRPAIAARKVVPGVVVGATSPAAIETRKKSLYRINASEYQAIEKEK